MTKNSIMNINIESRKSAIYTVFISFLVIASVFIFKTILVPTLFSVVFMGILFLMFKDDFNFLQISTIILFAVVGSQLELNTFIGTIYFYYIPVGIFMLTTFINLLRKKDIGISMPKKSWVIAFAATLGYMFFTILISSNKAVAIQNIKYHVLMVIVFFILFTAIQKKEYRHKLYNLFIVLLIGVLVIGCLEIFRVDLGMKTALKALDPEVYNSLGSYHDSIPAAFFYNQNNYSVVLVFAIFILCGDIVFSKNKFRIILNSILYVVCIVNLIFTMTRTSMISLYLCLFAGLIAMFICFRKNKQYILRYVAVFACALLIVQGLDLFEPLKPFYSKMQVLSGILGLQSEEELPDDMDIPEIEIGGSGSVNVRLTLVDNVISGIIKEKKYLGFGPGNTELYIKSLDNTNGIVNLHSFLLEILGNYGVFALLGFLLLFMIAAIRLIKGYLKADDEYRKIILAVGLSLLSSCFTSFAPSSVSNFPIFFIFLGALIGFSFSCDLKKTYQ